MRKVDNISEKGESERTFRIDLIDGTYSEITVLIDGDEWVLQGDETQRFSQSELEYILKKIKELNSVSFSKTIRKVKKK